MKCRLCGKYEDEKGRGPLVRYSIRHYVHQACGFEKWGAAFLDKIPHELGRLAFMDLQDRGLLAEVQRRYKAWQGGRV